MKRLIRKILDRLPNNYRPYHCWPLWILVATLKTWAVTDLKTGIYLYIKQVRSIHKRSEIRR